MASLVALRGQPIGTVLNRLIPVQVREYRPSIVFAGCTFLLVCSLLLGGGTHGGFLSDALLELIAIPMLLMSLWSLVGLPIWRAKSRRDIRVALVFCCVIALLPLIQLVPLPPWIWTNLPGREQIVKALELLGEQAPWMPISVSPHATWLSFLSLLPPMALFLGAIQLNYRERRELSLVILAVGVVSVFVGLTQVAEGPASLLRFFTVTNDTEAVGFFANRNHFAALLYAVLMFAAVWAIELGSNIKSWTDLKTFEARKVAALLAIFLILIVIIAGEAMARSRAGLALTIVALLAVFALSFMDPRNTSSGKVSKIILAATIFAVILSMQFAVYRILGRFATDPLENARTVFAHNTITAAKAFMPFGSGSGSFVPVYQLFEQPSDTIANTYANHAHDDVLELWLETGLFGPILLTLFVIWFVFASLRLWRRPSMVSAFDCTLARAATIVIALLLTHSVVDYPMRTEAIMALFAVCCAFMIEPLKDAEEGVKFAASLERYLVQRKAGSGANAAAASPGLSSARPATPLAGGGALVPAREARRWGGEIEWPDEWRNANRAPEPPNPKTDIKNASKVDSEC
jgi:O-antigen ligase